MFTKSALAIAFLGGAEATTKYKSGHLGTFENFTYGKFKARIKT